MNGWLDQTSSYIGVQIYLASATRSCAKLLFKTKTILGMWGGPAIRLKSARERNRSDACAEGSFSFFRLHITTKYLKLLVLDKMNMIIGTHCNANINHLI